MARFWKCWSAPAVFAAFLVLGVSAHVSAQIKGVNTAGRFRLEPALAFGFGTSSLDLGTTTDGQTVEISGGGGLGAVISAGYGLSRSFDLDVGLGYQRSWLTPYNVENASGNFDRSFLLLTLKYKIPIQDRYQLKFGAGAGYYHPGALDVDTTGIFGGTHDVVQYDDSTGFHVTAEWEIFFTPDFSMVFGGKYYHVTYKEESGTRNGVPGFFPDGNIRDFDGSGFDLTVALGLYL